MSLFIASAYAQEAGQAPQGGELFQIGFLVLLFVLEFVVLVLIVLVVVLVVLVVVLVFLLVQC